MPRRLNVKFLLWVLGGLLAAGAGTHFLHEFQVKRNAAALRERAEMALADGQLRQAVSYLSQYLDYEPGDTDALAQYALARDALADSPSAHYQAWLLLEQAVRRAPDRADLREHAVRLALGLYRYDDAARHLQVLLQAAPARADLEYSLGWCEENDGHYAQAEAAYRRAVAHDPAFLAGYRRLAGVLHLHLERPEQAVKVLDDMVAANPKSVGAYLARAGFRHRLGAEDEAWADVTRARQLAPNHPDVLVTGAEVARARGDLASARAYLRRGLDLHPRDLRLYWLLASLDQQAGRTEDAVAALRRGLEKVPRSPDLHAGLAAVLAEGGGVKAAAEEVARARRAGADPALLDCIEARLLARQGRWAEARPLLERARPRLPERSAWQAQADFLLGRCYERLGDVGQQLAAFRRALAFDPTWAAPRLALGAALLGAGRLGEAVGELRQVADSADPPAEAWAVLARALVLTQLGRPEGQRDWEEAEAALRRAAPVLPAAPEVAALRAEVLAAQGKVSEAYALLRRTCRQQPSAAEPWVARADLAVRRGDWDRAAALLAEADRRPGGPLLARLGWVRYWAARGGQSARAALLRLAGEASELSGEQRARLQRGAAEALYRLGDVAAAARLWAELAGRYPGDLDSRFHLLELALESGTDGEVKRLVDEVRPIEGDEGALWRYGEAARLIARARRGRPDLLPQARRLLAEVGRRQRGWGRVSLLEAAADEVEGNAEAAVLHYLQALGQGEDRPRVVYRAARLLCDGGHYDQAAELVRKAERQPPLDRDLARLGAEVALKQHAYRRARDLARRAVPPGTRDYRDHLWLAQVLAAAGRPGQAEESLGRAVRAAPGLPEPWVALVRHLARQGRKDRAEEVLAEVRRKLSPERAALAEALGQEALGRSDLAARLYRVQLEARPNDLLLLGAAAEFYLRAGRREKAEALLRRLADPANGAPVDLAAAARRRLAVCLAGHGRPGAFREALALLDRNAQAAGAAAEDDRARAAVLATRPDHRPEAVRLLEQSRRRQALSAEEQYLLVRLYEAENEPAKARDAMLGLLNLDGQNPEYLAHYVRGLVDRRELDEARVYLGQLERLEPGSARTRELAAALRKARAGEAP
jgi:tetratricopeptide (TPR) repeat protein